MPHHVHDAGLDLGLGVDGRDGFGEALETVHHRDQDVSHFGHAFVANLDPQGVEDHYGKRGPGDGPATP